MDRIERKSLKILADTTRDNQGETDLTRDLEAAAETGDRSHYDKAKDSFDSLPPEERRSIGAGAVEQAETARIENRIANAAKQKPEASDASDEQEMLGLDWILGKSKAPSAPPAGAKKTKLVQAPEPKVRRQRFKDEEEDSWDWQKLPDDPTQKKPKKAGKDPLQELREQMLGPDTGHTWRRSLPSGE